MVIKNLCAFRSSGALKRYIDKEFFWCLLTYV
jgi:hypothetical protein